MDHELDFAIHLYQFAAMNQWYNLTSVPGACWPNKFESESSLIDQVYKQ